MGEGGDNTMACGNTSPLPAAEVSEDEISKTKDV
ncbi:hypothetical protein [Caudoviricetes sp.]|nr:hypothetical protein [Caudoviricetes sp.]UOF81024.1 hypothetical protein [Caudoviricetes sp.]UOF81420.1 hypothetical protein [Caudoviricetes sp.]